MSKVTIEGTNRPNTAIHEGERRTVERTPFVEKLIRNGFARVIEDQPSSNAAQVDTLLAQFVAETEPEETEPVPEFVDPFPTEPFAPVSDDDDDDDDDESRPNEDH